MAAEDEAKRSLQVHAHVLGRQLVPSLPPPGHSVT